MLDSEACRSALAGARSPQGLKPASLAAAFGTTKVVPCYKTTQTEFFRGPVTKQHADRIFPRRVKSCPLTDTEDRLRDNKKSRGMGHGAVNRVGNPRSQKRDTSTGSGQAPGQPATKCRPFDFVRRGGTLLRMTVRSWLGMAKRKGGEPSTLAASFLRAIYLAGVASRLTRSAISVRTASAFSSSASMDSSTAASSSRLRISAQRRRVP